MQLLVFYDNKRRSNKSKMKEWTKKRKRGKHIYDQFVLVLGIADFLHIHDRT